MINKYPSYSSIVEWFENNTIYEVKEIYFSVKAKPIVKLKYFGPSIKFYNCRYKISQEIPSEGLFRVN